MKLSKKIRMKLGFCVSKGCFNRATVDVEIPLVHYKGQLCDKCLEKIQDMGVFDSKENRND